MNRYFLPVGLLLALLAAMLYPGPGTMLQQLGLIPWMVVTIFLVNGYQINLNLVPRGRKLLAASAVAVAINLLVSPFIALMLVSALALPVGVATGLVVMATVPPTLTAGIIMTQIAGGNVPKALFLTILLNLIGVFTIPFMLHLTLDRVGLVPVSPLPVLTQLILIVLIPFVVGTGLRSVTRIPSRHWLLRYLPSSCVVGTVWMSASASSETLQAFDVTLLLLILVVALGVHGALLLLCWLARYLYRPDPGELIALLFTASQKTLPIALGVLAIMQQALGAAMVACLVFHFLQLIMDSMIASRMALARPAGRAG